ncbi:DFFRY protein [Pyrenophora seminiperda CCB06]|uniref:DFFRY protein n=1 Tax=Pyrenophora seminiperda CCB06 TaxID=1302712 RepID=A0A3M7M018_9PLEO|nr:DFFRY protein [Pyrenophora seminiperda CCB06]
MTAQDNHLAQSLAADEPANTAPASPPRRDPIEDADASFTRKRPRLHSGSNSLPTMGTDTGPQTPANTTASPAEKLVEMTIRSHPPSSPVPAGDEAANDVLDNAFPDSEQSLILITSSEDEPGSPPVMIIDDDDDDEPVGFAVQIDPANHFREFPYSHIGSHTTVVHDLAQHVYNNNDIDADFFSVLARWLNEFPDPPADVKGFYISKAIFWEDFATLVSKILYRRVPFTLQVPDRRMSDVFYAFLSAYVRICSFLLLADIELLAQTSSDDIHIPSLFASKHLRNLSTILRSDKAPAYHMINKEYSTDLRKLCLQLQQDFLAVDGAGNLFRLANQAIHRVSMNSQNSIAFNASQIVHTLGASIFAGQISISAQDRSDFSRGTLLFLEKYMDDLFNLDRTTDANTARDLILAFQCLLFDLCIWDKSIESQLVDKFLDFKSADSPTTSSSAEVTHTGDQDAYRRDPECFPALVSHAWKFKILRRYLTKGKMDLRMMSITAMDTGLIDIWRQYNDQDPSSRHPVMQYLADFLLDGNIVDYIISVDSHPQLIARSGNILGFLVVNHRWSDRETDATWNTVATSPDPRVISATMTMLRAIIHLMKPVDQMYLCAKLYELPISSYTMDISRFFGDLSLKIVDRASPEDYATRDHSAFPWNVCIRMLCDTMTNAERDKVMLGLHKEAIDHLRNLARHITTDERQAIYRECADHISNHSPKATGSVKVIYTLSTSIDSSGELFFQENQDVLCLILKEIPWFVEAEQEAGPSTHPSLGLRYRLELLALMICRAGDSIPTEIYQDLWEYTIGTRAISNNARNLAWVQILQTIHVFPNNEYCKRLVSEHLPNMEPKFYTHAMFDFVANYSFPTTRQRVRTEHGEKTVLQIPGADLLWPMIISSPEGTIEDLAAGLLADRYVHINEAEGITLGDVEAAHIVLVEKCMQEIQSACKIVRAHVSSRANAAISAAVSDRMVHDKEGHCRRIILFVKLLLEKIRQRPEFNRGRRADSKVDEMDVPYGDAIAVRFQSGNNERQTVMMGADHTLDDLYRKLCYVVGYTKLNLFARGQRLNVAERSNEKISEIDFGGQLLVQRAPEAEVTHPFSGTVTGSSVFESTVVKYFDELFSLMDSDDTISQMLFDYLTFFPAPSRIADGVMTDHTQSEDLFPPRKFFQARYAALALQARLQEQIRHTENHTLTALLTYAKSNLDEKFLGNAIRHLDAALLNPTLIAETITNFQELQLATVLVNVLLDFLRERPSAETSATYFSNGARLANRLVSILSVAMEMREDAMVINDCYGALLEASLHSRVIWEAFVKHPQVPSLHRVLLLEDSRQSVRENISRKIDSVCGGGLPFTCPLSKGEVVGQIWKGISAVLPDSIRYPKQSRQLFTMAEHVFRVQDEYERNESSLRSFLTTWSDLLLKHKHQEFVGQEETDYVVAGFTKLLLSCMMSLKSFKRPINAGDIMEQIFKKYIFTKSSSASEAGAAPVPILESHTRRELYDLMLAFVDDSSTYNNLLKLAGEVESEDYEPVMPTISVDRSTEIRSSTGYVGLYNPRAICYANSLLTQLFMNVNFRKFMLGLDLRERDGSQKLLLETQRLFTNMQHSFRRAADPRSFAACVKDSESMPIDISIQMDADEFYNSLFDQWECQLINEEHKQQFRSFYGGQTLNQIKSKECEHVSERAEPFFAVQCDVLGKSTLQESLQAFVRGDAMEGDNKYKCESCGGKYVNAVKRQVKLTTLLCKANNDRTCFKEVPDNLIFHLKRFEFDLTEFSRKKVYDHFEFPPTIDINVYHVDYLSDPSKPQQEDLFDLVGVLVHTGTCEHGHYYSYIRERPCSTGSTKPAWVEFDDSTVTPFDPADIAYRAFGGMMMEENCNRVQKQYSAYMLFYQRRTTLDADQRQWVASTNGRTLKVPMPEDLKKEVDVSNEALIREYCLLDPDHTTFVRQLHVMSRAINHGSCSEEHAQETDSLHIVLTHLGRIVWRHPTSEIFSKTLVQLRRSVLPCAMCCNIVLKFLAADDGALLNLLVRCPHAKVRSQIRSFFIDCLKVTRDQEPAMYGLEGLESDIDLDSPSPKEGLLTAVTFRLRQIADETYLGTRGWDDFYLTVTQIIEMGHSETAALLSHGFLHFCLTLLSLHVHKSFQERAPELLRILNKKSGIFNRLVACLSELLLRMDTDLPTIDRNLSGDRQGTLDRESMRFPLTSEERSMLFYWDSELKAIAVLDKALEIFDHSKVEHFYPGDIVISMLGWSNAQAQSNLFKTINDGITLDPPFCDAYVKASLSFCEASSSVDNVMKIINTITKAIASIPRVDEQRSLGGPAAIKFIAGLLKAENMAVFQQKHPHIFSYWVMSKACAWAPPLLLHTLESVRQDANILICELYKTHEDWSREMVQSHWATLRDLIAELVQRIIGGKDQGMLVSHLTQLIGACRYLVQQLYELAQSEDPAMVIYRDDEHDTHCIMQWREQVEPVIHSWPQDDGLSAGDLYEQSEFGSSTPSGNLRPLECSNYGGISRYSLGSTTDLVAREKKQASKEEKVTMANKLDAMKPQKKIELFSGSYFAACTVGGIIACGPTHTMVTPLDLVKCRRQVDSSLYKSNSQAWKMIYSKEGLRGVFFGWTPTFIGYSMQGAGKYGFYEIFKYLYGDKLAPGAPKQVVYLAASASAEFLADIALCPMEALKVRMQTTLPPFARNLREGWAKVIKEEGVGGLYKGLYPLWARQIPYTMVKFATFEETVTQIYKFLGNLKNRLDRCSRRVSASSVDISQVSGVQLCRILQSNPQSRIRDVMVSKLNSDRKPGEGAGQAIGRIYGKIGFAGLWNGLPVRIFMIGTLTAFQWLIYDSFKVYLGLPTTGGH